MKVVGHFDRLQFSPSESTTFIVLQISSHCPWRKDSQIQKMHLIPNSTVATKSRFSLQANIKTATRMNEWTLLPVHTGTMKLSVA